MDEDSNLVDAAVEGESSTGFKEIFPKCKTMEPNLFADDMPYPRSGHRLMTNNRYAVAIGGYNPALWNENNSPDTYYPILKEVWIFNLLTLRWSKMKTSGSMPKELASHAALLHDNYVVVYGGTGVPFGHNSSNKVHVLNMVDGAWRMMPLSAVPNNLQPQQQPTVAIPPEQYGHAFVRDKQKLYITGGTSGFEFNMQVFELSPVIAADSNTTELQCRSLLRGPELSPRYRHEAFVFDGKLHALGGGRTNTVCALDQIAVFDMSTGLWASVGATPDPKKGFPAPRRCHGLAVYESEATPDAVSIFISGGYDGTQGLDDVWELKVLRKGQNQVEYKWIRFAHDLPRRLYFHGMAATPNGKLLIFGGVDSETDEQRISNLYCCNLKPPPLSELALRKVLAHDPNMTEEKLLEKFKNIGLPPAYVDWIKNKW